MKLGSAPCGRRALKRAQATKPFWENLGLNNIDGRQIVENILSRMGTNQHVTVCKIWTAVNFSHMSGLKTPRCAIEGIQTSEQFMALSICILHCSLRIRTFSRPMEQDYYTSSISQYPWVSAARVGNPETHENSYIRWICPCS